MPKKQPKATAAAQDPRHHVDWPFTLVEASPAEIRAHSKPLARKAGCERPCTQVVTLLPKTLVNGRTGVGWQMVNVDGFRFINAHLVSDRLTSSTQRGFTLQLSFSLNPFVPAVGVVGESNHFFSFDGAMPTGGGAQRLTRCESSDLTVAGGLPRIGGIDQSHILRVPVLGPYVRASIFNEDSVARSGEVRAYLTT